MRPSSRPNRFPDSRPVAAFTLIEILIAVAIVTFLILLLAQIIASSQAIWRNSEARTDAFRDGRAALDLMTRDLALALTDNRAPTLTLSNLYTDPNDAVGPTNNQQIYALIPMQNRGDGTPTAAPIRTDICAIGFYCVWSVSRHAYVLRKHVLQSNPTYGRLQTAFGSPTVDPANVYNPSNPTTSPAEDEDIAAYVWDLKIRPYENVSGTPTLNSNYPIIYRAILPAFVEISFKAFSPQAARQLEAQNIGADVWFNTAAPIYTHQILPHVQLFSTRIRFQNAPAPK